MDLNSNVPAWVVGFIGRVVLQQEIERVTYQKKIAELEEMNRRLFDQIGEESGSVVDYETLLEKVKGGQNNDAG